MTCPKCKSTNVSVQAVTNVYSKKHGLAWWLLVSWWWWILWLLAFIPMLIIRLIRGNKTVSKTHSEAVCQNCGNRWRT